MKKFQSVIIFQQLTLTDLGPRDNLKIEIDKNIYNRKNVKTKDKLKHSSLLN